MPSAKCWGVYSSHFSRKAMIAEYFDHFDEGLTPKADFKLLLYFITSPQLQNLFHLILFVRIIYLSIKSANGHFNINSVLVQYYSCLGPRLKRSLQVE